MNQLPDRIRAFVAVPMNPAVDEAIGSFLDELRAQRARISWANPANLHVTLSFLGAAIESRLLPKFVASLHEIAAAAPPFELQARSIGAFPNLARPRVIWVGLHGDGLTQLAGRVERAAAEAGFRTQAESRARQPYSPHLTLGRVRELARYAEVRAALEAAATRDFGRSLIDSMTLYRSHLSSSGTTHQALEVFSFGLR